MNGVSLIECIQCGRDVDVEDHSLVDQPEGTHEFRISFTLGAKALAALVEAPPSVREPLVGDI